LIVGVDCNFTAYGIHFVTFTDSHCSFHILLSSILLTDAVWQ